MKKFMCLLLTAVMILSCNACAKKSPAVETAPAEEPPENTETIAPIEMKPVDEKVTINIWHTFQGKPGENFDKVVKEFNESQDYITVQAVAQSWDEYNSKIMAALTAKNAPDIIFCSTAGDVNNYVDIDTAVDLTPYIENENIGITDFNDFNPTIMAEAKQWDGKMYMLPVSRTGEVMYYNADFFKENNLEVPSTWTELHDLAISLTETSGEECMGSDFMDENFIDMMTQAGSDFIDYESKTANFDSELAVESLNYWKELADAGCLRMKGDDYNLLPSFASGLIQIVLQSSASYDRLMNNFDVQFEIGVAQMPTTEGTETDYVTMWGQNAVILKSDDLRQQAAFEFLKYWTSPENQAAWGIAYGALPIRESSIQLPEYQEFLNEALATKVLLEGYDRLGFKPAVTGGAAANNALASCIDEIVIGTLNVEEAIAQYKADADKALQG